MDKKIVEIFKLVRELNRKGESLSLQLDERGIDIRDNNNNFKQIIPHITGYIYFTSYWKKDYKDMIEGTLEVLRKRLKNRELNEIGYGD